MMERFPGIRRVFRLGIGSRELEEELAFHFEETRAELLGRGFSAEEADREMGRRFGDERRYRRELERLDRRSTAARSWVEWGDALGSGFRHAFRRLRRTPGFTLGVALTFALGIGANAIMFGIVDRLFLSPPAHVENADRVVRLVAERPSQLTGLREPVEALSYPDYEAFASVGAFEGVAAYARSDLTLGRGTEAREVAGRLVTGNFFSVLGARPALGRFFLPEDDGEGAAGVAVISHSLWRQEFGGDPDVLTRTIDFGKGPYPIVGVAPAGFTAGELERIDLWLPLHPTQTAVDGPAGPGVSWKGPNWQWLRMVARLAPGASLAQAEEQATAAYRAGRAASVGPGEVAREEEQQVTMMGAPLTAARGPLASDESVVAKWLAALSLIVLLIACANVANLLLVRAIQAQREVGIRLALGSSRARLIGQVLAESLLLAVAGAAAALLVTYWGGSLVRNVLLPEIAWAGPLLDGRTLAVVAGLALATGLAAGLLPAIHSIRRDVREIIGGSSRSIAPGSSRIRNALTVLQAALSVLLLVGAGLFVRSLQRVEQLDFGIDPTRVLYVEPVFEDGLAELDDPVVIGFYRAALERLGASGVVEHAAVTDAAPFRSLMGRSIRVAGRDSIPTMPGGGPYLHHVTPGYFHTLDLRMLRGRGFADVDPTDAATSVVIDATTARTLWPDEDAVGGCILLGRGDECTTVIGVVENARRFRIVGEDPAMFLYRPLQPERFGFGRALLLRVRGDPAETVPWVRRELLALEPRLRHAQIQPLEQIIAPQMRSWRLGASVLSAFGALALLVAAVGLYSVLAFGVAQRTRELGIRSALGASTAMLRSMVLRDGIRLVALGVAIGLVAAVVLAPRIESLLFEVHPHDPLVIAFAVLALGLVALAASSIPAWRATRVDPSVALRADG